MKIIITERQYKRILREQFEYKEKIFNLLNSGDEGLIEMVKHLSEGQGYDLKELLTEYFQEYGPPYFNILDILVDGFSQEEILNKIYGDDINIYEDDTGNYYPDYPIIIKGGKIEYVEFIEGYWWKWEFDDNGKQIYHEDSDGDWEKWEYDDKGNQIYYEDSDGDIRDNR